MKHFALYLVLIATGLFSCNDDKTSFKVSATDIQLEAGESEQHILVETDAKSWQTNVTGNWLIVERNLNELVISAVSNPTREERSARILLVAGKDYVNIHVKQPGSTRAVGDPYPNAENPVGIIYKLTEGGKHGKVLSLNDTAVLYWGEVTRVYPGARDMLNGRTNTRYMIEENKNMENFKIASTVFWWIYNTMNNRDIDGEWYLPAYFELEELYYILTGNQYIPQKASPNMTPKLTHNITVRNQFNVWLEQYGGIPIPFDNGEYTWHMSSTEYDQNRQRGIRFNAGTNTTIYNLSKRSTYFNWHVRPILEF